MKTGLDSFNTKYTFFRLRIKILMHLCNIIIGTEVPICFKTTYSDLEDLGCILQNYCEHRPYSRVNVFWYEHVQKIIIYLFFQ